MAHAELPVLAYKLALLVPTSRGQLMRLASERRLIAEYGRRMTGDRLVVGTSGNLSIRSGGLLAVTPAGRAYDTLTPELVCVQHLDGSPEEVDLAPTSELPFQQLIYANTDAAALVVCEHDADRLGRCQAAGCDRVDADVQRGPRRRYCSWACQNRSSVAAFRARRAS